jgi:hypothetical protein
MLCTKRCGSALLVIFLSLVGYLLLSSTAADAQAYLYNYSYVGAGNSPLGAVLADFNHDGRSDLAVVNYDNTVSVMLGAPNAAFGPPVTYPTGASPFTLIAADLRRNGRTDLVTLNMPNGIDQPGVVSVLLGNGDGTFQAHVDYSVGDFPTGVVAGDFNDDGKIDLAIANEFDNTISILYGNGDGTFQPQVAIDVGSEPTSIGTGDFNGDGRRDLIASCVGSGVVSVLLNTGAGKFTRMDTSSGLFSPDTSLVVTGKFTTSGKLDAVISSRTQGQLYLLKGEGNGSFMSPAPLVGTGAGEVYSLIAADINRDGKTDLAYGSVGPDEFSVLLGNGTGKFSTPIASPIFATESIALADINGDGFLDLVAAEQGLNSVAVVLGNGKGQFGLAKTDNLSGTVYGPDSTVVADFNGDGKLDLAVAETNFPTGQVAVSLGNGQGSFGTPVISPLLSEAINNQDLMLSGDFNGDGKPDLIIMDDYSTGFQVLLGNGDGTFQTPVDTKLNTTLNFAIGDFNGDGKTDAVVSTFSNGQELISIYLSKGDGTFTLGAQYTEQYGGPIVADVNRDGKPDLVFVGDPVFVMLGNGDGTFQKPITGPVVLGQSYAVINDFNGDGAPDIVVATSSGLAFLKGDGDGTFQSPVYSDSTTLLCCQILAEDVNGDGKLDLVNNGGSGVLVLLGNGDGTFQLPFAYGVNGQAYTGNILVGDFNSDGIGDIGVVFEDATSGTIDASLYLSSPTVALFPTVINFGSVAVGQTSPPVNVRLSNVGNRKLSISAIQISGNFVERNNCPKQLSIGKTCTIQVTFQPQSTGTQTGAVKISDSALGASQQISLTGVGK